MHKTLMQIPAILAAVVSMCLVSPIIVHASNASVVARIDSVPISLPIPLTFNEPSAGVPEVRVFGESITPPTNRLLAFFVPNRYETQFRSGSMSELDRYFMVQTARKSEPRTWNTADFSKMKAVLRDQGQQLLDRASPQIQGLIDSKVQNKSVWADSSVTDLRVGEIRVQEIFDETSNSISLLAVTKYTIRTGDVIQEQTMAMANTTLLIKGKIVFFYAYSHLRSPADIDWIRAQTKIWLRRASTENSQR